MRVQLLLLVGFMFAGQVCAQQALVRWAYGPFGTPGDAAFVVQKDRIIKRRVRSAPWAHVWVMRDDQVHHSADAFGRPGAAAYFAQENALVRCSGFNCQRGSCALVLEGNKVFRADGTFCNKAEGAFVLEENVVYLGEGAFATKGEAIPIIEGDLPMLALLTILAGL